MTDDLAEDFREIRTNIHEIDREEMETELATHGIGRAEIRSLNDVLDAVIKWSWFVEATLNKRSDTNDPE